MNRNTEMHFSQTPQINMKRSKFDESHSHKTTFNTGDVIPIYVDSDILPGDTVQLDMAELIRMATPIYPIMDNLFADVYFFFVPHRLTWEKWRQFWGENDNPWITNLPNLTVPQITAPTGGWTEGTIADYMGIPTKVDGFQINALPFRAYAKIWNDFFRDENLKNACHMYTDSTTRTGQIGTETGYTYVTGVEMGGLPAKAAKFHDYFTSALPSPQRGPAVQVPLGETATVISTNKVHELGPIADGKNYTIAPMTWGLYGTKGGKPYISSDVQYYQANTAPIYAYYDSTKQSTDTVFSETETSSTISGRIAPNNLYADLSTATAATINQLRTAFAIQKYYENAGLHGTRYIEYIRSVFGVTSSDARIQRAEYLGGMRCPLNIDQIIQTSSTDATSPQGNTAGFSCTINKDSLFTKSFEEHGTLMGLIVVRTDHTYQQGLEKMWTRKKWTDFYNPFFANLSEMPILNKNLYLQGSSVTDASGEPYDEQAFGYQEAWAEYRYKTNRVSGYMRSNATGSLDVWHFADDYNQMPYLSSEWIDETYTNVDRTIAVTSQLTHQFIADFYFKTYYTRPMPVYSVPGLIDHV